ncbi:PKD domain-containing protein [Mucilaginibacter paludis]|uniref:PKD domain containing protein n=1 Tax=Mucilaginibacter paludis DSM 18603 TaxID=714943 RepID=H1Y0B3_9SPHI|nr:PKD domain-containing protein [Mucilaginibacter paludis]EHQ28162.1 PKD domain containing protein [Mucilaginibacter paludis DSM 18603]
MHKQLPKHFKYENYIVIGHIALLFILCGGQSHAQSLGDPVVKITFGSGTASRAGALSADSGSTSYTYSGSGQVFEDYYTITNQVTAATHGGFVTSYDHDYETTGNTNGYMMVINGNVTAGTVYTRKVSNLCGNTQYQFSVWVKNVLSTSGILPNMVFHIYAADGTTDLATPVSTGDVPTGNVWHNYTANFTLPAGSENVVIKLVSNANGTVGNDFAVDDISFSPYGSTISTIFVGSTDDTETTCAGSAQTYTIKATSTLASGYVQKLQTYINGSWVDLSAASTNDTYTITTPTAAGTYQYRLVSALSDNITSANCVVASNQLTLTVQASAMPLIGVADTICLGNSTAFTDSTVVTGTTVKSWLWDFGDGTPSSSIQNPSHTYTTAGNKTVKLTLTNANGCVSSTASKTIYISTPPVAQFTIPSTGCINQPVTITDQSTAVDGTITSWLWDYGDGTTGDALVHTYTSTGSYTVTLMVKGSKGGCSSSTFRRITINPLPVVNFSLPSVCQSDFYSNFTDNTTIADNSGNFTYLWNFGDKNANTTYPNTSTSKNPQHHYSDTGRYVVSLTVTSINGCSVTATKTLTVNGATRKADFDVLDSLNLCSNREVMIANRSTVDFGSLTKVKVYFDYGGDTTLQVTDNSPYYGKLYRHTYPEFHSPATKTYKIYIEAHSGGSGSCEKDTLKVIMLRATPSVSFPAISAICQDAGTVQLAVNPVATALPATGVYAGTGVSATGVFDPSVSGVGAFPIQYIYTSTNGCADTVTQKITVNATPKVYAGADMTVLEGGSATMKATSSDSVIYSWSPATYLSNTTIKNPVVTPKSDITYTLTVTSNKGCTASSMVKVTVLKTPVIPNTFTPNGDSRNDTWVILYLDSYPGCTVDIYNRNGQKVYSSIGYPTAWDGRYNGADLPVGVYYYVINPKHGRSTLAGSVTIIR